MVILVIIMVIKLTQKSETKLKIFIVDNSVGKSGKTRLVLYRLAASINVLEVLTSTDNYLKTQSYFVS